MFFVCSTKSPFRIRRTLGSPGTAITSGAPLLDLAQYAFLDGNSRARDAAQLSVVSRSRRPGRLRLDRLASREPNSKNQIPRTKFQERRSRFFGSWFLE